MPAVVIVIVVYRKKQYSDVPEEHQKQVLENMICSADYHICNDNDIYGNRELELLGFSDIHCTDARFDDKFYGTLTDSTQCGSSGGIYGCMSNPNDLNNQCGAVNSIINEESLLETD
eukprot:755719_1